jgi:hypothetical protein
MANPIKTTEAHTPKTISEEIRGLRVAMGGHKTVGENTVMSGLQAAVVGISLVSGARVPIVRRQKNDFPPKIL